MTGYEDTRLALMGETPVCNPSLTVSANCISVELGCGRLRQLSVAGALLAAVMAGWFWFGNAGAGLLGLWMWASCWRDWRGGRRSLCVVREEVRYLRLSRHRVLCGYGLLRTWEVFSDELAPADFARLRREIKAWVDAGQQARQSL